MLALEARRMGYRTAVLDPDPDAPGAVVADEALTAPLDDVDAAHELARRSDVVTLEWENADVSTVVEMAELAPVRPGAHVLQVAQHRVREKDTARRLGLPTTDYRPVTSPAQLEAAVGELGTPSVLKTALGGYDGRGQRVLHTPSDASAAFDDLSDGATELILERWVDFRLEASVICARGPGGEMASFPVVRNIHRRGILDFTIAPAPVSPELEREARRIGEAMTEGLDVVGILAVELFVDHDDRVYVNEIAPRPHNSGHYTWEACSVSQFEQQIRAVCGLPLEPPVLLRPACMVNLLGDEIGTGLGVPGVADALRVPSVALHLYGKSTARPGRKMGHLTALADDPEQAYERAREAKARLTGSRP
jgi:5-(carboxyamino)imidazole ribonucleotide synthase